MIELKDVRQFLGEGWIKMEALLKGALLSDVDLLEQTNLNLLAHEGKMLRPMLTILIARACSGGEVNDIVVRYAAASELLHNATLLHDDVVDGSDRRRGLPTVNAELGSCASVLIGDFWLVKAMEMVMSCEDDYSSDKSPKVYSVFSSTLKDLAEGEMFQLQKARSCDTSEEDYYKIIFSKTASLFKACCVSATIAVKASEEFRKAAEEYAKALGIAFQIKDDILDYCGDEGIGKPVGEDLKEQKITLPLLGALSKLSEEEAKKVRKMVCEIPQNPANVQRLMDIVSENGGIGYAVERLNSFVQKAKDSLAILPDSEEKKLLIYLAEYTACRNL